jgi:hypothetical protein
MYSGIYISLILWFVLSTRKEAITQLKEERCTVGKNLWRVGTYVTPNFHISMDSDQFFGPTEGGIDEQWEIRREGVYAT